MQSPLLPSPPRSPSPRPQAALHQLVPQHWGTLPVSVAETLPPWEEKPKRPHHGSPPLHPYFVSVLHQPRLVGWLRVLAANQAPACAGLSVEGNLEGVQQAARRTTYEICITSWLKHGPSSQRTLPSRKDTMPRVCTHTHMGHLQDSARRLSGAEVSRGILPASSSRKPIRCTTVTQQGVIM